MALYTLAEFGTVIDVIAADLQLDMTPVEWLPLKTRSRRKCGDYTNSWYADIEPGEYRPELTHVIIRINLSLPLWEILDTIAHELRHYWQEVHHVTYVRSPERYNKDGWSCGQKLTQFFKGERVIRKYRDQNIEIDARAYAADAVRRLDLMSVYIESLPEHYKGKK